MIKCKIYRLLGILWGTMILLSIPIQNVSAGWKDHPACSMGGHQRHHCDHRLPPGYVGPYEHSHDYEFHGFTYGLPFGAKKIFAGGISYYYHDGIFYRKCNKRGYDIVKAPHGTLVHHLPIGYQTFYRSGSKYYRHHNTFYQSVSGGYRVIECPEERIVFQGDDYHFHFSISKY